MYEKPFEAEEVQNYSQKCCVALVLDTSSSMAGDSIDQLNFGIQSFLKEIRPYFDRNQTLVISIG